MGLKEKLIKDMKEAMKAKDKVRLSTIRMINSLIKNAEIDKRGELTDEEIVSLLQKYAKQRRESIELYEKGGRQDLVEKEKAELAIVESYLPEQMGEDEIRKVVEEAIAETGASSLKDLGKIMKIVIPKVKGKADGSVVNRIARELLSGES
ncbi:GatB/YqeY domain-containing protein [Desulfurobacterium indicum]|uniref:Glutamyl-tRNA amidotransferase n=1 Tax=Desulfurobacterium indicum TaxID=1914305 RepID=A0A1R1MNP2_9BACT|nr:GatB/YqeY domain-containing protein [Desulfurobacterium indicum]OMH41396.1 glutamyl-tRNA amidotransferase [Desulfurobacterium indicum]